MHTSCRRDRAEPLARPARHDMRPRRRNAIARHRTRAVLALVGSALLIMAIAVPVTAGPGSRPFKGSVAGEVAFNEVPVTVCPNYGGLRTESSAIGTSTHLGKTRMTALHCTPLGDDFGPGTMTLTSASGDEVWITYNGSAPFPGEGVTVYQGSLKFKVVGGTGRFKDAVGGGTMVIEIVFQGFEDPAWPAKWVWNGTIGY